MKKTVSRINTHESWASFSGHLLRFILRWVSWKITLVDRHVFPWGKVWNSRYFGAVSFGLVLVDHFRVSAKLGSVSVPRTSCLDRNLFLDLFESVWFFILMSSMQQSSLLATSDDLIPVASANQVFEMSASSTKVPKRDSANIALIGAGWW